MSSEERVTSPVTEMTHISTYRYAPACPTKERNVDEKWYVLLKAVADNSFLISNLFSRQKDMYLSLFLH